MSDRAIEVTGLRKTYGDLEAVAGIDLAVDVGEVFALLGPNGAGKTTTVEILEGYRQRTAGEVSVLGFDPAGRERALRERVGIVLQSTGVDPYLTVRETVALYAGYYPSPRDVDEVVELVGLAEKGDTRVLKLSGGQQRRLDVAIALAGDAELLFLDEPTTGFDPGARRNAWEIVSNLSSIGKTVFLTTHYMDEAQHLANRVAVIAHGTIVAEGPPGSLAGRDRMRTSIRFRLPPGAPEPDRTAHRLPDGGYELRADQEETTKLVHDLTAWALESGFVLDALEVTPPSLEDVYLELTASEDVTA
ncbi:MAG TPA: ABC transporter ATP-binding protein [Actinomycetota bacterium]|nr:ABC transporter ATP-binding protein [Actinomycetota bacterium]